MPKIAGKTDLERVEELLEGPLPVKGMSCGAPTIVLEMAEARALRAELARLRKALRELVEVVQAEMAESCYGACAKCKLAMERRCLRKRVGDSLAKAVLARSKQLPCPKNKMGWRECGSLTHRDENHVAYCDVTGKPCVLCLAEGEQAEDEKAMNHSLVEKWKARAEQMERMATTWRTEAGMWETSSEDAKARALKAEGWWRKLRERIGGHTMAAIVGGKYTEQGFSISELMSAIEQPGK